MIGRAVSLLPLLLLTGLALLAAAGNTGGEADFANRLAPPSLAHPFGTDALGRDLLVRSWAALMLSLQIGLLAATASSCVAVLLALTASTHKFAALGVDFVTDAALSLPHLVLLVLICFALGGGAQALVIAIALSHWPRLARLLRLELQQVLGTDYVTASRGFGRSRWFIATRHILPHLLPQLLTGTVLMLPHAILHEAGLTFLGFGLEPTRPAIGILLAEAMQYLNAGYWWLGLFPGAALVLLVLCIEKLGQGLYRSVNPRAGETWS